MFTLQTKNDTHNQTIAFKFELSGGVRSSYSTKTKTISCKNITSAGEFNVPVEYEMNKLMKNQKYFLKFYDEFSGFLAAGQGLYFY